MAVGRAVQTVKRVSGRLLANPTQAFAGGTYPYGGTELGRVQDVELEPLSQQVVIEYELLGKVGAVINPGIRWRFRATLRGFDDDALALLFASSSAAGELSQHRGLDVPGTLEVGGSADARSLLLVYVPDDPTDHPAIILWAAYPDWSDGARMRFDHRYDLTLPVVCECVEDSDGRCLSVGRLVDYDVTA